MGARRTLCPHTCTMRLSTAALALALALVLSAAASASILDQAKALLTETLAQREGKAAAPLAVKVAGSSPAEGDDADVDRPGRHHRRRKEFVRPRFCEDKDCPKFELRDT